MISTTSPTSVKDRTAIWLDRGLLIAVLLTCVLAMSHHKADPDFWGHVQYARDALREGLPTTTTYSYTTEGRRWINHENLSELLMAVGVDWVGPAGLLMVKSLLALLVTVLIYREGVRSQMAAVPLYFTLLLVASNLMYSWTLRPQLLTYLCFTLMIALFSWCFRAWPQPWPLPLRGRDPAETVHDQTRVKVDHARLQALWLLVPLFIVWTNSHGGFVAGYCIMAAYLGLRSVELLWAEGRHAVRTVVFLAAIAAVSGAATMVNPYGLELHRWLLTALGNPRPEITEWGPPELMNLIWLGWWLMVVVYFVALVGSRRPRDITHIAILCLTLWQACEHRRHIAFFAILFGLWMPMHVGSIWLRLRGKTEEETDTAAMNPRTRRVLAAALSLVVIAMGAALFAHNRHIPVRRDSYPVSAFEYITDQNLSGNLIVRFKWAQYAIAAFSVPSDERPHLKVAFDGRFRTCYPQEVIDMYFDFAIGDAPPELRFRSPNSPPVDGSRILEYKNPDLVLIDRAQTYAVKIMEEHKDRWTLLYQDSMAQLWGRAEKYDDPHSPDYVSPPRRVIGDEPQEGKVPWPALPQRRAGIVRSVHLAR